MLDIFHLLFFFCYLHTRIKNDDKMIQAEGVESLSEAELREDCRERGMLGLRSVEEMRQQVLSFSFLFSCHFIHSWIHGALLCLGLSICIQTDAFSLDSVQLHRLLSIECGCDFSYQPQWFYIRDSMFWFHRWFLCRKFMFK